VDIENKVNKAMDGSESVNKADMPTRITAATSITNDYFFPGNGIWQPMTIRAYDRIEAEATHKLKRQPVAQTEPLKPAEEEKVVDSKETTNEK